MMMWPLRFARASVLLALSSTFNPRLVNGAGPTAVRRQVSETPASTTASVVEPEITAVSDCHLHGTIQYCMVGTTEFRISGTPEGATSLPSSYTACHNHGSETWCMASTDEVEILLAVETSAPVTGTLTSSPTTTSFTAVSECHLHGSSMFCMAGVTEYYIHTTMTATSDIPAAFTGCHQHGSDTYCMSPTGDDVEVTLATEDASEDGGDAEEPAEENCHFHAGVEHCVGGSSSDEGETERSCERVDRDYNVRLRVGLLFVILATSAIGVFGPIFLVSFVPPRNIIFSMLKQFGTGVIISTAFVHLLTHATLMFENECLGELAFEGTATAILMAGLFLSFLVEFAGHRFMRWHAGKKKAANVEASSTTTTTAQLLASTEMVNISVLEAGIIFHSLIIGLTLVVSGDSFFLTLFAVIVFHQMFEGVALGTRIAALGRDPQASSSSSLRHGHSRSSSPATHGTSDDTQQQATTADSHADQEAKSLTPGGVPLRKKLFLAAAFAIVTPLGMGIGIGVLKRFNGNDPSTIVAIGTLDALSAGILVWVGVVEMWAHDWMLGGEMASASPLRTLLGLTSLVAGMALMSFLGKWA